MHYDILAPVVEELSSLLTGARVERVLQGEDGGLYLLFRKERMNFSLLISPERSLPRLHLVSRKPRSASDPHPSGSSSEEPSSRDPTDAYRPFER